MLIRTCEMMWMVSFPLLLHPRPPEANHFALSGVVLGHGGCALRGWDARYNQMCTLHVMETEATEVTALRPPWSAILNRKGGEGGSQNQWNVYFAGVLINSYSGELAASWGFINWLTNPWGVDQRSGPHRHWGSRGNEPGRWEELNCFPSTGHYFFFKWIIGL